MPFDWECVGPDIDVITDKLPLPCKCKKDHCWHIPKKQDRHPVTGADIRNYGFTIQCCKCSMLKLAELKIGILIIFIDAYDKPGRYTIQLPDEVITKIATEEPDMEEE